MKITAAGIGYVGMGNAIVFSTANEVTLFDIDPLRVKKINEGEAPFPDEEISAYLHEHKPHLKATLDAVEAFSNAELVVVATPTFYDEQTGHFDTSSVASIIEQVKAINPKAWIIIRSTVGVGFTEQISKKTDFYKLIFMPEFLREGHAIEDSFNPSRIIIGALPSGEGKEKAKEIISLLQKCGVEKDAPCLVVSTGEAESIKLFANTYLALRVAFFNELDGFALSKGLDSKAIIEGLGLDSRIGDYYNNPSFGYGGYCLPKDTKELKANFGGVPENIITAIIESNRTRKEFIVSSVISRLGGQGKVGVYGLSMKRGSSNFRESSVIDVIKGLKERKIGVIIYEPRIDENEYMGCAVLSDLNEFKTQSDLILANRYDESLADVKTKVFTRDLLFGD